MTTLKIGIASLDQFKKMTMDIASGQIVPDKESPKIWFSSMESFAKLLSEKNRELLSIIANTKPSSLNELAEKTGRAKSNLSRTLKTMERYGLVSLEKGEGRQVIPRVNYTDLELELPLYKQYHQPDSHI